MLTDLMTTIEIHPLFMIIMGYDPGVSPNMDAPWNDAIQNIGGRVMGTAFIFLAVLGVIFVLVWLFGRFGRNAGAQEGGLSNLLWVLLGAVFIASISGAITWFSGFELF